MDKPRKKGNTITVKINGDPKPFQETPKKQEPEANPTPKLKVIKTGASEAEQEVILETAAAQETAEESFDWIIPESSDQNFEEIPAKSEKTIKSGSKLANPFTPYFKKNRRPIGSIVTVAFFAILIGTTIGLFMLKLVIVESDDKPVTGTITEEEEKASGTTDTEDKTSATIKEIATYLVQGGIFTSTDSAKDVAAQLKSKGIPAQILEMEGKQYIFLGAGDSLEAAKTLGGQYKADGVKDAFAKPLTIKEKTVSDITESDKEFLESVPAIYQTLTQAITNPSEESLGKAEQSLKTSGLKNEKVQKLKTELSNAHENIQSYQKSKDKKKLNEAQQNLLDFLAQYYSM
ncbi:SPOR domain-containing protein [Neobacillus sp. Marseille-QA0830]